MGRYLFVATLQPIHVVEAQGKVVADGANGTGGVTDSGHGGRQLGLVNRLNDDEAKEDKSDKKPSLEREAEAKRPNEEIEARHGVDPEAEGAWAGPR